MQDMNKSFKVYFMMAFVFISVTRRIIYWLRNFKQSKEGEKIGLNKVKTENVSHFSMR